MQWTATVWFMTCKGGGCCWDNSTMVGVTAAVSFPAPASFSQVHPNNCCIGHNICQEYNDFLFIGILAPLVELRAEGLSSGGQQSQTNALVTTAQALWQLWWNEEIRQSEDNSVALC